MHLANDELTRFAYEAEQVVRDFAAALAQQDRTMRAAAERSARLAPR